MKKVYKVFFQNQFNLSVFLKYNIINKDKTVLVNGSGVNLVEHKPLKYPEDNGVNFLFIGRIMKEKGIDELLLAAKKIIKEYPNVQFNLLGYMEENYSKIIEELSHEKIINYHGFQNDTINYISQSHCVILPSYHEGMSNSLLEGAALARPLIASNIPGCKEIIINNISGYLCDAKSVDDLYEKIVMFIKLSYYKKKKWLLILENILKINLIEKLL